MSRQTASALVVLCLSFAPAIAPAAAGPQSGHRHAVRGEIVFVGGYFYDPFFGPYPWWPRMAYPYWYFPMYDNRAQVRLLVTPREAGVYVDGFYAGIVDDFDSFFQRLPLPPGEHEITLYLESYRTVRQWIYLTPGSTFKLQVTLERLPIGERSEPPAIAPSVPPPPAGSYTAPRTAPDARLHEPPQRTPAMPQVECGTLILRVQPVQADVMIDGERWASSDGEHFAVHIPTGPHRVEVSKEGYRSFVTDVQVRDGDTTALNISLSPETP